MAYQAPFAIICACAGWAVLQHAKHTSDFALGGIFALLCLQFLAKIGLAVLLSTGDNPYVYAYSLYASLSQTIGAILSLGLGITLLTVILFGALQTQFSASRHDHLSGLLNRLGFTHAAGRRRTRDASSDLWLAILDLDHFKSINDKHGHAAGDEVIRATAGLLMSSFSDGDTGRIGGEEFIVLFVAPDIRAATERCEGFCTHLATHQLSTGLSRLRVTTSIGLTRWEPSERLDDAMFRADRALYDAKHLGRNAVRVQLQGFAVGSKPDATAAPAPGSSSVSTA